MQANQITFLLKQWQLNAEFWAREKDETRAAAARTKVRSLQTRLQWANQRTALYNVQK